MDLNIKIFEYKSEPPPQLRNILDGNHFSIVWPLTNLVEYSAQWRHIMSHYIILIANNYIRIPEAAKTGFRVTMKQFFLTFN